MKRITILAGKLVVVLGGDGPLHSGRIESSLKEFCLLCGKIDCEPGCQADAEETRDRVAYNRVMDGIESLILAHACTGIDIASPQYLEGLETALEAISQRF